MSDWLAGINWTQLSEIVILIICFTGVSVVFIKHGLPLVLQHRKEVKEIEASGKKGVLSEEISSRLGKLEKTTTALETSIVAIEAGIERLSSDIIANQDFTKKVSVDNLENTLFTGVRGIFETLKAFRRLLALGRNGRVWEHGFKLILASPANKETWLNVLSTDLGFDIAMEHQNYYDERLAEIRKRIYDDFTKA